ncbi:MAG: tRNA guanosine(15) transglycosylase TgtA [Methanosarcinaceae archaeon]|nr:tRNA guanosine(15) transglycosylase TgtA [Methanosarcinaceae archaeon]
MSIFEIIEKDGAGRIGRLKTAHGIVETPTVMPVINPNINLIKPSEMREFGAEMLITNSYIIYSHEDLREKALSLGVHGLLDFDGPVMTDSGSFQLSVYGDIRVSNSEIIDFQMKIKTDIGVPLDVPTPPDVSYEVAEKELELTNERIAEARRIVPKYSDFIKSSESCQMLLAGPVQGSLYDDLRVKSGNFVRELGCDVFPIGAVVPLMSNYRYSDLVDVIVSSKKGLGPSVPVHLFGAGHPMMFALAVSLGCDLFDSAAYALYAKNDRYITVNGTYPLDRLKHLPCSCPICMQNTADSIRKSENKEELLSRHNLYVTFEEIRRIKQAISEGRLLELVELRCHSHPRMLDALYALKKHGAWMEKYDTATKSTFLDCGTFSSHRPEVIRFRNRLERFTVSGTSIIRSGKTSIDRNFDNLFSFKPPFGAYPSELDGNYPFNAEVSLNQDEDVIETAISNTIHLIKQNPDAEFTFVKSKQLRFIPECFFNELSEICKIIDKVEQDTVNEFENNI